MNNPDIFIQAIDPFIAVMLVTDIILLVFILRKTILDQDKWSVLDKEDKRFILGVTLYFLIFIVWEITVTSVIFLEKNNIDDAYIFLDFIDPLLSIILITNIFTALSIVFGIFKDKQKNSTDLFLSVIASYFIVLVVWEIVIASEIILT
jgi:hypothetical protein